jgi:TIR domain
VPGMADIEEIVVPEIPAPPPCPVRQLIFLSHASPEDNAFARWLATQLAIAGYEVWCDVTNLLGGEAFWKDIAEAIDSYAFRVLFVSTLEGNRKPGTLRELKLALEAQQRHGLTDFVVPLKIDAFPFASMQKSLGDLNCIRFDENWAAGLSQLLKLLERENAPKSSSAGPSAVTAWYRRSIDPKRRIVVANERCYSNWFQMRMPPQLYFHRSATDADTLSRFAAALKLPHRVHGTYLATFAPLHEVQERLGPEAHFIETVSVNTTEFIEKGSEELQIASFDAANIVSDLVRQAWDTTLDGRGLGTFLLASGLSARFFSNGQLAKNRAYFSAHGRNRSYRQLVGNKSKRTPDGEKVPDGFWHYALSASPQLVPFPRLVLRHHVIFTDDGVKPWEKADRMHKARRSVCKQWWNREWRDRLFAFASELSGGGKELALPVSREAAITLSMAPMNFISPWGYFEQGADGLNENMDIELVEEEIDGEDDDDGAR